MRHQNSVLYGITLEEPTCCILCAGQGETAAGEMESGTAAKVLKRFSIPLVLMTAHGVLVALVAPAACHEF